MAPPLADNERPFSIFLSGNREVKDYHFSPDEWPSLAYNDFKGDAVDIPTISFSELQKSNAQCDSRSRLRQQVLEAAREWGFFNVVDHGVPLDLMKRLQDECRGLFLLPLEQKNRARRTAGIPLGYSPSNPDYGTNLPWVENVQVQQSPEKIVEFSTRIWDDQHQHFSDTVIAYSDAVKKLGFQILDLIAEALGLASNHFSQHFTDPEMALLRINHYLPCPEPFRCLGLGAHSDPQSITLLLQDNVPGLQVVHKGQWVASRPVPGAITVNIGDTLQAWTNKRVTSEEHRAVVNPIHHRLSVAYFFNPSKETLIQPDAELVDHEHPPCYKPFTMGEFQYQLIKQKRVTRKFALDRYKV